MTDLMYLKVNVSSYKRKEQPTQCHRCQRYGHAKSGCHHPPRCVKCAGDHFSSECPFKGKIDNPKCVLCNGPHVASFRGCPKAPKPKLVVEATEEVEPQDQNSQRPTLVPRPLLLAKEQAQKPRAFNSEPVRNGTSFSQALTPNEVPFDPAIPGTSRQQDTPIPQSDNQSPSSPDTPNIVDDDINLFDLIRQFQNLVKCINFKHILQIIKNAANKLKSVKGIMAKIEVGVTAFEELVSALNYE